MALIEIFNQEIQVELNLDDELVNQFLADFQSLIFWDDKYSKELRSEIKTWSYLDLGILFETITYETNKNKKIKSYQSHSILFNQLKMNFLTILNGENYNLYEKVYLTFLFVKGFLNVSSEAANKCQSILDKLWGQVESSGIKIQFFKPIFGAFYTIIAGKFFNLTTEFMTRRNLVGALISKFYNFEEYDKEYWYNILLNEQLHPFLFVTICEGLSTIVEMTLDFAKEIPMGDDRDNFLSRSSFYSEILTDYILSYLRKFYNLTSSDDSSKLIENFDSIEIQTFLKYKLKMSFISGVKSRILLNYIRAEDDKFKPQIGLYFEMLRQIEGEKGCKLYKIDFSLLTNSYQFIWIFSEIERETLMKFSIILSPTFEDEIIKISSDIFMYLNQKYDKTGKIDIEGFEILVSFLGEWLQLFSTSELLIQESLMILSAIITICLSQITRGYYEAKKVQKAFVTYLNLLYFINFTEIKINELSNSKASKTIKNNQSDIINKFKNLIQDLDMGMLLKPDYVKDISTSFESSIIKRTGMGSESGDPELMGMLSEDMVFGFIDQIQNFEDFILQESTSSQNLSNDIDLFPIYYPPERDTFIRFEKIGLTCKNLSKQEIPFPLIRNVDELATALTLFPFNVSFPVAFYKKSLFHSISSILSTDL